MQANSRTPEIQGVAAQTWGTMYVPVRNGTTTIQVKGDLLESRTKLSTGTQTIWTRIQTVNSVEIIQSPAYALIGLGLFILLWGLGLFAVEVALGLIVSAVGIAIMVYAWLNKRRLLVIYASSSTLPIFMNQPTDTYEKFGLGVLGLSRQLNSSQPNSARPATRRPA